MTWRGGLIHSPRPTMKRLTNRSIAEMRTQARCRSAPGKAERMAVCQSCNAPIAWAKTDNGRPMPMDVLPSPEGTFAFVTPGRVRFVPVADREGYALHTSHFATCPFADKHRREK